MPVFIWYSAGTWSFDSVKHDLTNAMSSTCFATFGYFSQTHAPDSPYCRNVNGDFISGPGLPLKTSIAIRLPCVLVELRLGVEQVDGARRAFHEQPDDRLGLGGEVRGTRRERVARAAIVVGRRCGRAEQVRQRAQPQPRPRPGQEFPAACRARRNARSFDAAQST